MRPKESALDIPEIFYKPAHKEQVSGPSKWVLNTVLRVGTLMMCPGDDIAMVIASSSNAFDSHSSSPSAILYETPRLPRPITIYIGRERLKNNPLK